MAGALILFFGLTAVAGAAFLGGPIGQQPTVSPQMRIVGPHVFRAGEPVPVRVAYQDFDLQPQLRCGPAGPCTGSSPQTVVDGRAQGHIHVYLQRVTGGFENVDSDSFCIPATKTLSGDYEGTASGNCAAVPKGLYRMTAEFQSNSHLSALKAENKPQDVPPSDATYVRAYGQ
jgi:hypothetical protein